MFKLKQWFYLTWTKVLKSPFFGNMMKKVTESASSKKMIPYFIKYYGVQPTSIMKPIKEYQSIHDFFTRQITIEEGQFGQTATEYNSPVEARVKSFGAIQEGMTFNIKNKHYSAEELIGKDDIDFSNSHYIIMYLSPSNYHRFHAPIKGHYRKLYNLGTTSYPVNDAATTYVDDLFTKNYRAVYQMNQDYYVPVGALNINSITETFEQDSVLEAGSELGYFSFGSTVILFLMNKNIEWCDSIKVDQAISLGETIAKIKS